MGLFFTPWDLSLHLGFFPLPQVEHIAIPAAPAYLHGIRVLFLSDIHLRRRVSDARLTALMGMIAAQQADLILLGGDYAETDDQCARFFSAFRSVSAPLGCFGVIGNNDDRRTLPAHMAAAGVQLLLNQSVAIDLPNGSLQLGGCDEYKFGSPDSQGLFSGEGYRILLSHFPIQPACPAELMLSGHTHGGQLNLLGVTPYSLGFERKLRPLAVRGRHRLGGMQLMICNGVGVSRLPLRLGAKPQLLAIEFG